MDLYRGLEKRFHQKASPDLELPCRLSEQPKTLTTTQPTSFLYSLMTKKNAQIPVQLRQLFSDPQYSDNIFFSCVTP